MAFHLAAALDVLLDGAYISLFCNLQVWTAVERPNRIQGFQTLAGGDGKSVGGLQTLRDLHQFVLF